MTKVRAYNYIYLKTQSKKVKTSTDCFTSADHQEVSKLGFKVSLVVIVKLVNYAYYTKNLT